MLEVDVDAGLAAELSDFFSFYVPGYKFMPAYKNKVWDGKIKLFNRMSGELSAGLYVYLVKFAAERNYTLDTEESQYGFPLVKDRVPEFDEFLKVEYLPFQPRDYQYDAVVTALERSRAILLSPTGSGKSFIAYLLIKYYMSMIEQHKKILIVVPTTSLVEQMESDFLDYGMRGPHPVHKIYSVTAFKNIFFFLIFIYSMICK